MHVCNLQTKDVLDLLKAIHGLIIENEKHIPIRGRKKQTMQHIPIRDGKKQTM